MFNFKSVLKFLLLVVLVAGIGGGVYVFLNLNTLAKPVTERIASETLGVRVSIGSMDIALQDKRVSVSGIKIANPRGFKKPNAVTIDQVSITLASISKELIRFKDISVGGTQAYLEVTEKGTNLQALQKGIKVQPKPEGKADIKVIIDRLAVRKAKLNPSVTLLAQQDLQSVDVPDVTLRAIGKKENGVLASEAIAQIAPVLLKSFSKAAGNAGFYQGLSKDTLKELGAAQVKGVTDQISKEIDAVSGKLKGLFK